MSTHLNFPVDFIWGTSTSSYQIEGAWQEDGRSESIWDRFSHTPGRVKDGGTGDDAIDHYHRWPEDVSILKSLGVDAYRFSTAWPRILPQGRGPVNQKGLNFYSRLVDTLLEANIKPVVTLYHWDLPVALQDAGGWPSRDTAEAFAEYADVVSAALGDRVKHWITQNEPWCISILSHELGIHAPGWKDTYAALRAAHHVLLGHGWAVPVLRANSPGAEVGITLNFEWMLPASASAADREAAWDIDGSYNRWFLDPIFGRRYPADSVARYAAALPNGLDFIQPGDYEVIATPLDFLGVNYYTRKVLRDETAADNLPQTIFADLPRTEMGWEVYPEGLYNLLCRIHFEYSPPKMYITENGVSYLDGPDANGRIADTNRIDYLRDHIHAVYRAMECGAPIGGYFVWSLLDNFEWAEGYTQRFGIVYVDWATKQRLLKDSAHWYRDVVANGLTLPG